MAGAWSEDDCERVVELGMQETCWGMMLELGLCVFCIEVYAVVSADSTEMWVMAGCIRGNDHVGCAIWLGCEWKFV